MTGKRDLNTEVIDWLLGYPSAFTCEEDLNYALRELGRQLEEMTT